MRKTYNEMVSFIKQSKIPALVVEKVDRLTRNYQDASIIDNWINSNPEHQVHFVKEKLIIKKFPST